MHYDLRKNASVLFAVGSHIHCQEPVVSAFSHASDLFGWEDDIDLFFASFSEFGGMSFDDGDTFALVFERDDSVGEFSGFAPEDDFVMVEDTLSEEHSSDGSDVNL